MHRVAEYRGLAAKFRREAESASLPQDRKELLDTAERWELLAEERERTTRSSDNDHKGDFQ